jgi:tetratricopeptide (TPR) repeat protein
MTPFSLTSWVKTKCPESDRNPFGVGSWILFGTRCSRWETTIPAATLGCTSKPLWGWRFRSTALGFLLAFWLAIPVMAEGPTGRSKTLRDGMRALYRGDYKVAVEVGREQAKARPQEPAPRVLIARSEMAQGNYQKAFEELRAALGTSPENLEVLHFLGQLCALLSQAEYERLFALAPDSARVHQIMAESYRAQENLAKAEEEYEAALKADPALIEVLNILGDMKRYQFRMQEAIEYYSRAIKINPRDYDSQYGLGASHLYQQQPDLAVEDFRRALSIHPKSAAAQLALGDALLRLEQTQQAAEHFKAAIRIEPKLRQAYTLLGRAYQKLGMSEEAKQAFRQSQELIQGELEQARERKGRGTKQMVVESKRPEKKQP